MSIYYSKFSLNSYAGTTYFQAQLPNSFPVYLVLQASRAFRRLPPNLRELATLAKRWAAQHDQKPAEIDRWYDAAGYELDPDTGRALTDAEIDAQWGGGPDPSLLRFTGQDIPIPAGGFPDPDTWEEAPPEPEEPLEDPKDLGPPDRRWRERVGAKYKWADPDDRPTVSRLTSDLSRGPEAVMYTYGLTEDQLPTFEESKAAFREDAIRVLGSPYFDGREEERAFLAEALARVDIQSDLCDRRAQIIYDQAEAALPKAARR